MVEAGRGIGEGGRATAGEDMDGARRIVAAKDVFMKDKKMVISLYRGYIRQPFFSLGPL